MSQEVIQNVEIRDIQQMLLPISSADEDRQLLTFLAGALYAYGQVEKALLSSLISKIAQLFQISQQNGQNEIKQTIFRSLINNTQQKPLIYVEELSKSIEGQIICKENNEINNQDRKIILDVQIIEGQQGQKEILDNNIGECEFNQRECDKNEKQQANSLKNSEINNQENKSILDVQIQEEVEYQKNQYDNQGKLSQIKCEFSETQETNISKNIKLNNQDQKSKLDEHSEDEEEEQKEAYDNQEKLNKVELDLNERQQRNSIIKTELNCWNIKSNFYDENQEEEEEESKEMNEIKGQLNQIHQQLKGMQYSGDINNLNYVCKICQDQTESEDFYYAECNHIFHNQCLAQYLNEQISKKNIQLKCPHANCQYDIPQTTLKQILNQEQFEAFQQVSLSTFLNTNDLQIQRCPTKDCLFAFVNEDNLTLLDCPFCKKIYCLSCNCLYHENLTCQEHQMLIGNQEIKGREQDLDRKESLPFKNSQIQIEKVSTNLNQINKSDQDKHQSLQNKQLEDENDWNCEICCENMTNSLYLPLSCDHIFHKKCLSQYFNTQISEKKFPINCPSSTCNLPVQQYDLEEVLNVDEFQKYEQFCLQNYIDSNQDEMSWCLTPNCGYAFILVSGQYSLDCPKCMKSYCLNCKCEYHKNQTCQEYKISKNFTEDDQKLEQLAIDQKFKKCSKCKMWVEKNQGCDHMTCRCGHQFCYKCGGPYLQCGCPLYNNLNLIRQLDHQDLMNSSLFDEQVIYNNYSYEFNDDSSDDDDIDLPFNHTRIYPQNSFNFYIQQNQMSNFNFQQRQTQMINQQNQRQNDLNQFRPQNQKFGFKFQQSQSQIRNQQFFQQNIPNLKNNLEQNQISGNNDHFQNMHQIGKEQFIQPYSSQNLHHQFNENNLNLNYQPNQFNQLEINREQQLQNSSEQSRHLPINQNNQTKLTQQNQSKFKKNLKSQNNSYNRRVNGIRNDSQYQNNQNSTLQFDSMISIQRQGSLLENSQINLSESQHYFRNSQTQHQLIQDDFPQQKKQSAQDLNTSNNRRKNKRGNDNENIQNNNFQHLLIYDDFPYQKKQFSQESNTSNNRRKYKRGTDNENIQNNNFNSSFNQNEYDLNIQFSPNPFTQPENNKYTQKTGNRYNKNFQYQNNKNSTFEFKDMTSVDNEKNQNNRFNSSFYQNESNLNMSPNPFIQPESNQYTEKRGSRYNSNSVKQNNRNSTSYFNEINQEVLSATSIQNQEISQDKFQLNELEKIQNSQNEHQKMQHDFNNQQQQQVSQDKNTDSNRRKYKKPKKFNQENNIN